MPFCPVCKSEYREGVKTCADCGHELVDSLPPEPPKENETEIIIDDKPAFLVSLSSNIECGCIEGCLETAGIPYSKRDRGAGGYIGVYMGYSVFGADYFVPSKFLEKAKDVLDASAPPEGWGAAEEKSPDNDAQNSETETDSSEVEKDIENPVGRAYKIKRVVASIIIVAIVLAFLSSYIMGAIRGLFNL